MRHHTAWFWLGGTFTAFATAFIAYAAALSAARTGYPLWASVQMVAAYIFAAAAVACMVAAIRGVRFPFVTASVSKSWATETRAAGSRWGARPLCNKGKLEVMLECYQRGARVTGLRCVVHHPSGVVAVATNAVAEAFDAERFNYVVWDYPGEFVRRGRGPVPDFVPGEYRFVWLAQVPEQAGAVELCDCLWDVPADGEPRLLRYGKEQIG